MIKCKKFLYTGFMRHLYYRIKLKPILRKSPWCSLWAWCRLSWHWSCHCRLENTIICVWNRCNGPWWYHGLGMPDVLPGKVYRAEDGPLVEIYSRRPQIFIDPRSLMINDREFWRTLVLLIRLLHYLRNPDRVSQGRGRWRLYEHLWRHKYMHSCRTAFIYVDWHM